jgi:large subunit ribosomal protein L9
MRVILLERVRNLGNMGQEVTVKDGYGRNYLLPKSKALRATEANKELFAKKKAEYEIKNSDKKSVAEKQADILRGFVLEIVAAAQTNGKLYGSITVRDLAHQLHEKKQDVQRAHIVMPKPITETGVYTIRILPHPEVSVDITVVVGSTQEELNLLQKGTTEEDEESKPELEQEPIVAAAVSEEPEEKAKTKTKKKIEESKSTEQD